MRILRGLPRHVSGVLLHLLACGQLSVVAGRVPVRVMEVLRLVDDLVLLLERLPCRPATLALLLLLVFLLLPLEHLELLPLLLSRFLGVIGLDLERLGQLWAGRLLSLDLLPFLLHRRLLDLDEVDVHLRVLVLPLEANEHVVLAHVNHRRVIPTAVRSVDGSHLGACAPPMRVGSLVRPHLVEINLRRIAVPEESHKVSILCERDNFSVIPLAVELVDRLTLLADCEGAHLVRLA
mmetsp:Transcript_22157/g.47856  ORF Transcript_22157/g.47856 Transcript_22157/m.47856 type:complete len:236 (+) Transcript_22157:327-1034(+)